jgi:hypothetical protein
MKKTTGHVTGVAGSPWHRIEEIEGRVDKLLLDVAVLADKVDKLLDYVKAHEASVKNLELKVARKTGGKSGSKD